MEQRVENRGKYLYIKLSGEFSLEEFEPGFPNLLRVLKEVNLSKIILDCRDVHGYLAGIQRFMINDWLAAVNIQYHDKEHPPLKICAVVNDEIYDPAKFGETVAKNRGLNIYNTLDIDEAYKWLDVTPSVTPVVIIQYR